MVTIEGLDANMCCGTHVKNLAVRDAVVVRSLGLALGLEKEEDVQGCDC